MCGTTANNFRHLGKWGGKLAQNSELNVQAGFFFFTISITSNYIWTCKIGTELQIIT